MVDRGDPVKLRVVLWDRRPRALENLPEFYRPLPHGQRARAEPDDELAQRIRGERPRFRQPQWLGGCPGLRPPSSRRTLHPAGRRSRRRPRGAGRHDLVPRVRATPASRSPTSGIRRAWPSARAVATPIRRPVNVPGPMPTAIRSISAQRGGLTLEQLRDERHQLRRVPWANAGGWIVSTLEFDAGFVVEQSDGGRRCGGVEAEDFHGLSMNTTRTSPPAWSIRTRAAMRARPAIESSSPRGHSTNVIVSAPR